MQYTTKTLFAAFAFVGLMCAFVVFLSPRRGLEIAAKNVPLDSSCPLKRLPTTATNVSYSYGGIQTNTYYEFEIEESEFIDWIEKIARFQKFPIGQQTSRFDQNGKTINWVRLKGGLAYHWQDPQAADRAENVRYDRKTGKCYYWYAPFYPE